MAIDIDDSTGRFSGYKGCRYSNLCAASCFQSSRAVWPVLRMSTIGTGKTATPQIAQNAHKFIRKIVGDNIPIIYGGSVNSKNIIDLIAMPDINGALIGGASLNVDDFKEVLKLVNKMGQLNHA